MGVGPGEDRNDTALLYFGEEMVVRQAVRLNVGVNQPQDGHDAGMFGDRNESAGKPPGTEREITLREANEVFLTGNENESQEADTITKGNRKEVYMRGSPGCGKRWTTTRKD